MPNLADIVKGMTPKEKVFLNTYFDGVKDQRAKQRYRLFELFNKGKVKSDNEASIMLYGKGRSAAYTRLKTKLVEDISNVMLLRSDQRLTSLNLVNMRFRCRKLISTAEVYFARSAYNAGYDIIYKAQGLAKKYELACELTTIYEILSGVVGFRKGIEMYNTYLNKMESSLILQNEIKIAKNHYFQVALPNMFSKSETFNSKGYLRKAIPEVEQLTNYRNSPQIRFFYYHLKMFIHEIEQDYEQGVEAAMLLLKLVQTEPAVKTPSYEGSAYIQVALLSLYGGLYKQAYEHSHKLFNFFKSGKHNQLIVEEIVFQACMHLQDIAGMKGVIDRVEKHPKITYSNLTFDKWNLYRAFYHYICKEYDHAFKLLQKQSSLLKDSTGWLASYKLLEIYILIAKKEYDLIDFRIAAFNKLIQRHKEKESRLKLIADILQSWKKHEYNFETSSEAKKEVLEKLAVKKGPLAFKALGSEVIPFHIWFAERSKPKANKES